MSYRDDALSDAKDTIENFKDEIVEQLLEKGEASDDLLNDYPNGDSYHHESHTDRSYRLSEAAEVLDELHQYEETDNGLWEGLEPREAIGAQAAYTYGNAVYGMFQRFIKQINDDFEIGELVEIRDTIQEIDEGDSKHPSVVDRLREAMGGYYDGEGTVVSALKAIEAGIRKNIDAILEDS